MRTKEFIDKLKHKYSYDDKTTTALTKLIPALLEYYGQEYEKLIFDALENTKITLCNSYQTIQLLKKEQTLTKTYNENESSNIKTSDVLYTSDVLITYNEEENEYKIEETKRQIIISHTFNLDSPKGLEVLTYGVICLIKSFKDEFTIIDNVLYKRMGNQIKIKQIVFNNNEISLNFLQEEATALQLGLNIYDTQEVTSLILKDKYTCYDYESLYKIAMILKEKLGLSNMIIKQELENEKDLFLNEYTLSLYEELLDICEKCMKEEEEMVIFASKREEKDAIKSKITQILNNEAFNNFVNYLYSKKETKIKN